MTIIAISVAAVVANSANTDLLLIEGAVRNEGFTSKQGTAFRLNSGRNWSTPGAGSDGCDIGRARAGGRSR